MPKGSLNVSLKGADDIFSTEESRQEQQREQVQQIPIGELFPFKNHPFKVLDDPGLSDGEVIDELIKASIYGFEHGPEVVTISAAEGIHYVPYDAAMQKKSPYWESTYKACNIPFTDFQIRYQPEQVRIVDGKRILEDTAFLCRKDNDHFLILPSIYEKLDLDDWLLAHLFFYDKDGKRCIGVELSEDD